MFLIRAIETDEDAFLCDMAETYHIYDCQALPLSYCATLAAGLRDDSRIKMALMEAKADIDTMLRASIADSLAFIAWTKTADAEKNRNRPKSILSKILDEESNKKHDRQVFSSIEEFERAWNEEK